MTKQQYYTILTGWRMPNRKLHFQTCSATSHWVCECEFVCIELCIGPYAVCVCIRANICYKYMCCIQCHRRCCRHAKHPELMPSIPYYFCAFCYCFPFFVFSLCAVQLLLFFRTFVFSRFRVLFKFEMLTKMVVNKYTDAHSQTRTFSALCHRIQFSCDFGMMPTHFDCCNAHIYGFTWMCISITPLLLLCERRSFARKSKDKINAICTK